MKAPTDKKIWFPAKTYGWGWGPPVCWQGWVVLGVYVALVIAEAIWILKDPNRLLEFYAYVAGLSVIFVGICWIKGEPPAWRWGKRK